MMQGMEISLGVISTTLLQRHGKKVSEMVDAEDGIEVLKSFGRLGIVDGGHHHTVITKIKEWFPDRNRPHG